MNRASQGFLALWEIQKGCMGEVTPEDAEKENATEKAQGASMSSSHLCIQRQDREQASKCAMT